jgi:hypothetical protein
VEAEYLSRQVPDVIIGHVSTINIGFILPDRVETTTELNRLLVYNPISVLINVFKFSSSIYNDCYYFSNYTLLLHRLGDRPT